MGGYLQLNSPHSWAGGLLMKENGMRKRTPWNKLDWSLIASRSQLYYLYWIKGMNLIELSDHLGVSHIALENHLKEINFKRRGRHKEPTKTYAIKKILKENPQLKTKRIAELTGSSPAWVRKVKASLIEEKEAA